MNRITSLGGALGGERGRASLLAGVRPALVRIREGLGVGERVALLVAFAALGVAAVVVAVSTRLDVLLEATGVAAALVAVLLSLRWPLLPLFAFALLIPIEEVVVLGGLGTLSRYAEIIFIVAYGIPRLGRLTVRAMPLPAWGYVAWAILSVGWALNPNPTLTEIPILVLLFATAVAVAALVTERPAIVRPLLWSYSLSAAAIAAVGLYLFLAAGVIPGPNDRAAALQDQNPAYYAAILLPAFVFSLYELINGRWVAISCAVAVMSAGAIAASGTRGAWVAIIVVVVLFILPRLEPVRRMAAIAIIATLGIVALQIPGLATLITQRVDIAVSSGGAGRTDIWTVGLNIYSSAPLTGVGLANFPVAYTPELVRQSDVGIYSANNPANRAPHNIVIGTLGELGPVGLFLLASFLGPLVLRPGWGPDAAVVQAALASLVTTALFLDVLNRKQVWLLAGLACGLAYLARSERLQNNARPFGRRLIRSPSAAITTSTAIGGPGRPDRS